MTQEDRINGLTGTLGVKAPVRVATTANITLSGLQAIDGVTVVADDRVLVKNQTAPAGNGIYVASATAWSRAPDFDGPRDVVKGTRVSINEGSTLAGQVWSISSATPTTIGTSSVTFGLASTSVTAADIASIINSATTKATPVDADALGLWDSVTSTLKKLTWANLKATLKTYFDTLYTYIAVSSHSAAYTTVLADANTGLLHPAADNNARTFTIDSNANVAFPVGTTISFCNEVNTVTIAITTDTLVLAGTGTTGSRTLAANGTATAWKVTTTKWYIMGSGLT